jgi:hypothetical protein
MTCCGLYLNTVSVVDNEQVRFIELGKSTVEGTAETIAVFYGFFSSVYFEMG